MGPLPSRFWGKSLKNNAFCGNIGDWQRDAMVRGNVSFRIAHKLKVVKIVIKLWCKEEEWKEDIEMKYLLDDIEAIDGKEGENTLSTEDLAHREAPKLELTNIMQMEEIFGDINRELDGSERGVGLLSFFIVWKSL